MAIIVIALPLAFALIPQILPGWRWLAGYVVVVAILLITSPSIEAVVFPAPKGGLGEAHFLSYDLLFGGSAALGIVGRGIGLALKHWRAPSVAVLAAELAPSAIALALFVGSPAWNDRPPSQACSAALFDVRVGDQTFHVRPAALVDIDSPAGAPRGVLGYSMEARDSLNQLCDATNTGRQSIRAGGIVLDFFAFSDRPFLWHTFQHPVEPDRVQKIEQFCRLFAGQHWATTACSDLRGGNVRALPQSMVIARRDSGACSIPLSPPHDCTYNSFLQISAGTRSLDDSDDYWLHEIAARTDRQSAVGNYTRHDVSIDARDPDRTLTRTYFVAGPSLPRDARGLPVVLECGIYRARTIGDLTCEVAYPLTTALFVAYSFAVPEDTVSERASAMDAYVRMVVVELQKPAAS